MFIKYITIFCYYCKALLHRLSRDHRKAARRLIENVYNKNLMLDDFSQIGSNSPDIIFVSFSKDGMLSFH
jgi:hypothetical protein